MNDYVVQAGSEGGSMIVTEKFTIGDQYWVTCDNGSIVRLESEESYDYIEVGTDLGVCIWGDEDESDLDEAYVSPVPEMETFLLPEVKHG